MFLKQFKNRLAYQIKREIALICLQCSPGDEGLDDGDDAEEHLDGVAPDLHN